MCPTVLDFFATLRLCGNPSGKDFWRKSSRKDAKAKRGLRKTMIAVRIIFLLLLAGTVAGCSYLPFDEDCGYSAYYKSPKDGSEIRIQFRVVEAEVVGGHRNCGFKDVPTKVISAAVGGVEMREIKVADNEYLYSAPSDFDPRKDVIDIKVYRGGNYVSDPASVKQIGESVYFNLR